MPTDRSLRRRFARTLLAFGAGVALLIGALGNAINQRIENEMWRAMLALEMEVYTDHLRRGLDRPGRTGGRLHTFSLAPAEPLPAGVPAEIGALAAGLHDEVAAGERWYSVLIRERDGRRIYVVMEITDFERTEAHLFLLMLAVVAAMVALLYAASRLLARTMAEPVLRLAREVTDLDPAERGARLDAGGMDAELSTIAAAIDGYLERLDTFVQREHEFISAVSHELRTPMATIAGAAELLRGKDGAGGALPLARIEQGVRDLEETLATLLYLATDPAPWREAEPCRLEELIPAVVRDHEHLLDARSQAIAVGPLEPTSIDAPARIVYIAVGNLLRNAIEHSFAGTIEIELARGVLRVSDHGPGMSAEEIARAYTADVRRADAPRARGLGLYLIRRICARFGWQIEFETGAARGTTVRLDFRAGATPPGSLRN